MVVMKMKTLVDGLSDIINDYIEGELEPETETMFLNYLENNSELAAFVQKSYQGKIAFRQAYEVCAADDFEDKLALRIGLERAMEAVEKGK